MKYIALLRGINVGGNSRVEMKKLKIQFENLGFTEVSTYINSGNVVFSSMLKQKEVLKKIAALFSKEYTFPIPVIVKTAKQMREIASAIPKHWKQDAKEFRSDVAYLFPEADSASSIELLPINKEVVEVQYVKGALMWHLNRKNLGRSNLNKLIGSKIYKLMTMRNINTAKYLGSF